MSEHRRYSVHATNAEARTAERALWSRYLDRERASRGLTTRDSLDRRRGRALPVAEAVTTAVGRVREVAGVSLVDVGTPEASAEADLLTHDELPPLVRDALEDDGVAAAPRVIR